MDRTGSTLQKQLSHPRIALPHRTHARNFTQYATAPSLRCAACYVIKYLFRSGGTNGCRTRKTRTFCLLSLWAAGATIVSRVPWSSHAAFG